MNDFTFISVPRTGTCAIHKALKTDHKNNHKAMKLIEPNGFSFGFVRNPYEQLKSWYDYHNKQKDLIQYQCNFNEWVANGCQHHWDKGYMEYAGVSHPCQQSDYLTNDKGEIIVHFIGVYEILSSEWKYVCKKLEIVVDLEYVNFSKPPNIYKNNAIEFLTNDNKKLVQKMFKQTFKLYRNVLTEPRRYHSS